MSALAPAVSAPTGKSPESEAARLYQRHHRAVFGSCLQQLRRREDAEDAVQTTFVYALMSLRRGVVPEFELPWLLKIAANVCSSRRRSDTRRGNVESPRDLDLLHDAASVTPRPSRMLDTERLRSALADMPASQRQAILLREWRGLSYNEIGDELGLSKPATETLLFRARNTLARKLRETHATYGVNAAAYLSNLRALLAGGAAKAAAIGFALSVAAAPVIVHEVGHALSPAPAAHVRTPPAHRVAHPSVAKREARRSVRHRRSHSATASSASGGGGAASAVVRANDGAAHALAPAAPSADVTRPSSATAPAPSAAVPPPASALPPLTNQVTTPLPVVPPAVSPPTALPDVPHVALPSVPTVQTPTLPTP